MADKKQTEFTVTDRRRFAGEALRVSQRSGQVVLDRVHALTVSTIAMTATISNNEKPRCLKPELLPTFTRPSVVLISLAPVCIATPLRARRRSATF